MKKERSIYMKYKKSIILIIILLLLIGCGDKKESSSNTDNTPTGSSTPETNKQLYCEEGTLKDDKCEIVLTTEGTTKCETDYALKDGKCTKTETLAAKSTKTCDKDYTLSGNICISTETYDKETQKVCELTKEYDRGSYKWVNGEEMESSAFVDEGKCYNSACSRFKDGVCVDIVVAEVSFIDKQTCQSGTKEVNGQCHKTATPKTTYTCEEGTLNNNKCTITKEVDPTITCENEYTYNSETKQCEKINIVEAQEK